MKNLEFFCIPTSRFLVAFSLVSKIASLTDVKLKNRQWIKKTNKKKQ